MGAHSGAACGVASSILCRATSGWDMFCDVALADVLLPPAGIVFGKMKGKGVALELRDLHATDTVAFAGLWRDYLAFYKVVLSEAVNHSTWARLIDAQHPVTARVAVLDGAMVGFAIHMHHASTWVLGDDCYLEDLFVAESARGHGIGRALIDDLLVLARTKGWHRVYWHTDAGNTRARTLYDQYTPSDGHIRYRLRL
jgi:GNAT superfamily N-acetyltransferase